MPADVAHHPRVCSDVLVQLRPELVVDLGPLRHRFADCLKAMDCLGHVDRALKIADLSVVAIERKDGLPVAGARKRIGRSPHKLHILMRHQWTQYPACRMRGSDPEAGSA